VLVILYMPHGLVNPNWFRRIFRKKEAPHAQA
jgi:hypothetical protein